MAESAIVGVFEPRGSCRRMPSDSPSGCSAKPHATGVASAPSGRPRPTSPTPGVSEIAPQLFAAELIVPATFACPDSVFDVQICEIVPVNADPDMFRCHVTMTVMPFDTLVA